jgi:ribosomal protein L5
MNITMVTTATDTKGGRELLRRFGLPFRDTQKQAN